LKLMRNAILSIFKKFFERNLVERPNEAKLDSVFLMLYFVVFLERSVLMLTSHSYLPLNIKRGTLHICSSFSADGRCSDSQCSALHIC
ncbi:hypothetical protein NL529_30035, partial [Klebsiella pneumoniae]|nr:hypothetical protein [Klebsiella pneumoniae]